jgi:hypothetical protein
MNSNHGEESEHKRDLPNFLQGLNSIVPGLHLQFGHPGVSTSIQGTATVDGTHHRATGTTLADSGAFNSCVTEEFTLRAKARSVKVNKTSFPTMTMTNGTRTKPKEFMSIQVQLTTATSITIYAWLIRQDHSILSWDPMCF